MGVSKGLGFPVAAPPGVGRMPSKGEDEQEAARVFYVAATRATHRLVIGSSGNGNFCAALRKLCDCGIRINGVLSNSKTAHCYI